MALTLTLLGGFQARLSAGSLLTLPTKKVQALLTYLALPPGREHARDKLATLLWGDLTQGHARQSLRQALFAVRQATAPVRPACLCIERASIALNAKAVDVDAVRFERLVGEGTREALGQAVDLYRGDLLDGMPRQDGPFEEWLLGERERLRELVVEALSGLLAAERAAGAVEAALQSGLRLIALDPLQEPVHRTLMRLYAQLGRRGSALHQYQLCLGIMQRELGVEPEEQTKQLYQEILRSGHRANRLEVEAPPTVSLARDTLRMLTASSTIPLIGRDSEMTRLGTALDIARRGNGQVLIMRGEAGVGKSRLVAELAAKAQEDCRVLIGRCYESEQILPFGPWVDALRTATVHAAEEVRNLPLPNRTELARLLPELTPAADPSTGPPDPLKLFEAVTALLRHLASRRPVILFLEDLHWADEMTLRLLAFLSRRLQGWPVLVVATARVEELSDLPVLRRTLDELDRESHVARLELAPLSQAATASLVQLLARNGLEPAEFGRLVDEIWRTSEGNPFVVIESMRAFNQGILSSEPDAVSLPERVRDVIARRLDRLSDRGHELIALAAVIGREFEFGLLQRVSGLGEEETARRVEELTRRRVLHSVGERLDFTHDRVREVAYGRILAPRRKALHRRVAKALAALHAKDLEPPHLALGLHYAEGEVWGQAVVHLRRAGVRALERAANREAVTCLERALTALAHLPESRPTLEDAFDIRLELRTALSRLAEIRGSRERLREAETLAERLSDDRRRALACAFLTNAHSWLGELDAALAFGSRARELAAVLGDVELQFLATTYLAQAHYHRGEHERAVQMAAHNLAVLPPHRAHDYFVGVDAPASVYDRVWLVLGLAHLGRFAEAIERAAEMSRLAESTQYAFPACSAYYGASALYLLKGDWAKAGAAIERWIEAARKGDFARHRAYAVAWSAWALAQLGEVPRAVSQLSEGEQLLDSQAATGHIGTLGWDYHALGRASLLLSRLDEAQRLGERALERSPSRAGFAAYAFHLLADIATHPDRFDAGRGEAHYRQALALAERRGMRPLIAHCHLGLGRLYRHTGKGPESHAHLTTAKTMYRDMDMRFWLEKAETARGHRSTETERAQ